MDYGKIDYTCRANGSGDIVLRLTLIGQRDDDVISAQGIAALRQKRIVRLTREAEQQGCLLGYEDLQSLLLTSLSTIKRDVMYLESRNLRIPLRNRRKTTCESNGDNDYSSVLMTEGM